MFYCTFNYEFMACFISMCHSYAPYVLSTLQRRNIKINTPYHAVALKRQFEEDAKLKKKKKGDTWVLSLFSRKRDSSTK